MCSGTGQLTSETSDSTRVVTIAAELAYSGFLWSFCQTAAVGSSQDSPALTLNYTLCRPHTPKKSHRPRLTRAHCHWFAVGPIHCSWSRGSDYQPEQLRLL